MRTTPIPVPVSTFETRRRHEGLKVTKANKDGGFATPKTMTVTRMATPRGPILVTNCDEQRTGIRYKVWGFGTRARDIAPIPYWRIK